MRLWPSSAARLCLSFIPSFNQGPLRLWSCTEGPHHIIIKPRGRYCCPPTHTYIWLYTLTPEFCLIQLHSCTDRGQSSNNELKKKWPCWSEASKAITSSHKLSSLKILANSLEHPADTQPLRSFACWVNKLNNTFVRLWETFSLDDGVADHPHICSSILSAPVVALAETPSGQAYVRTIDVTQPHWVSISACLTFRCKDIKKKTISSGSFKPHWSSFFINWLKATVGVLPSPPKSHSHDSSGVSCGLWKLGE